MICGRGVSGARGLYAAILLPEIHQVTLINPPASHREGPIFLNILRYADLPEAAALLSPRRLNFLARMPEAYSQTREIFALYGRKDHVFLSMSLEGLLAGRCHHGLVSGW